MNLNLQIQNFSRNKAELEYKLECNDKFWNEKCKNMNKNLLKTTDENLVLKKRLQGCLAEIKDLKHAK